MINLDEKDRYEIALMDKIHNFIDNPIVFGATGFFQSSPYRRMECNNIYTLGLQQFTDKNEKFKDAKPGLIRAFSEIDLKQVIDIQKRVEESSGELTKTDVSVIETDTFLKSIYKQETFFSLFAEQSSLYDLIWEHLKEPSQDESSFEENAARILRYILRRPTPVRVRLTVEDNKDNLNNSEKKKSTKKLIKNITDLSLLR